MIQALFLSLALTQAAPIVTADRLAQVYFLYVEGRSLAEDDNLPGAIGKYREALAVFPSAAEIRAELAGLYAQQGNLTDAEAEAARALAIDASNRSAHRLIGLIQASRVPRVERSAVTALIDSAIKHLEQSAVVPVRDPAVMLTLGELYVRAGNFAKAIPTLQQFLIDRPDYPQAVMLLTQAYRDSGQPEAAQALVDGFGGGSTESPEGRLREAEALEGRGEWGRAADAWSKVLGDDPKNVAARLRYAAALANAGDVVKGRGELTALTRDEPGEVSAWHLLVQVEMRSGRLDAAEVAARQIEVIAPADPRGPLALAGVKAARNDYRGVVAVLERRVASPLSADLSTGLFTEMAAQLADAWMEVGNAKRAIATLEGARRQVPDDVELAFALGAAYDQTRDFDKAEQVFRDVIAAEPDHAPALNYLGYMLAERGRKLTEAVGFIERALVIDADNPSYLDSLGWAFFKQRRFADAVGPLERAAAGAPRSSVIQDHLGDAYVSLKRHTEAVAAFDRAIAGDQAGVDPSSLTKKRDRARESAGKR